MGLNTRENCKHLPPKKIISFLHSTNRFFFLILFLLFMLMFNVPPSALAGGEQDITGSVQLISSRLMYDRSTKVSYLLVSLKNVSQNIYLSPVKVVITNISDSRVTVSNADGVTENGKPYFLYKPSSGIFASDYATEVKQWSFSNPNALRFTYSYTILGCIPEAAATIGPSGGTVEVTNPSSLIYGTKIEIPPGALVDSKDIGIGIDTKPAFLPGNSQPAGEYIQLVPHGTQFNTPVIISLPYNDKDNDGFVDGTTMPEATVGVKYYDEISNKWVDIDVFSRNPNVNTVSFMTNHFSTYIPYVATPPCNNLNFKDIPWLVSTWKSTGLSEWRCENANLNNNTLSLKHIVKYDDKSNKYYYGAEIQSTERYGYGKYTARIKVPPKTATGIVAAFYLYYKDKENASLVDEADVELTPGDGKITLGTYNNWNEKLDGYERKDGIRDKKYIERPDSWWGDTGEPHTFVIDKQKDKTIFSIDGSEVFTTIRQVKHCEWEKDNSGKDIYVCTDGAPVDVDQYIMFNIWAPIDNNQWPGIGAPTSIPSTYMEIESVSFEPEPKPHISVSPSTLSFGNVTVGSSSTAQTITVSNTGSAALVINSIAVSTFDPFQFVIQNDHCSGQTVNVSGSCTFQAIFSPSSEGAKTANISIPSNDPATPTLIALSGTGTAMPISQRPLTHWGYAPFLLNVAGYPGMYLMNYNNRVTNFDTTDVTVTWPDRSVTITSPFRSGSAPNATFQITALRRSSPITGGIPATVNVTEVGHDAFQEWGYLSSLAVMWDGALNYYIDGNHPYVVGDITPVSALNALTAQGISVQYSGTTNASYTKNVPSDSHFITADTNGSFTCNVNFGTRTLSNISFAAVGGGHSYSYTNGTASWTAGDNHFYTSSGTATIDGASVPYHGVYGTFFGPSAEKVGFYFGLTTSSADPHIQGTLRGSR